MKHLLLLLIPFCLFLIGCNDDDALLDPAYQPVGESAFTDCVNAESWQLDDVNFQINEMIQFGDYFVFGGFSNLLIMDEDLETVVVDEEVEGRKLLPIGDKLIICGQDGLYEFASNTETFSTLDASVFCQDIIIGPDGELLIANGSSLTQSVLEYNFVQGGLRPYSDVPLVDEICTGVFDLALSENDKVWVSTCRDLILKFDSRTFEAAFNTEDEPLLQGRSDDLFLLPYQDGVVVVAKNGTGFYQILKYTGGEWIELIHFSLLNSVTTSKEVFMTRPSIMEAFIKDDLLYVATVLAGCEGIQRFDISKNEELTEDDYDAFEDPFYNNQCINGMTLEGDGDVYILVNGNQLVRVDC